MPFDYENNILAVVNALNGYNTTTSNPDLSSGLTRRVQNVYRNDPSIVGMRGDIYPCVFVRINRKTEDFAGLGMTGPTRARKEAVANFDVISFYRKDGGHSQHTNVLLEIERLAENIEGVFQAEPTLSGTAMWCQPVTTEFYGPYQNQAMWIKACVINLEARYHFR